MLSKQTRNDGKRSHNTVDPDNPQKNKPDSNKITKKDDKPKNKISEEDAKKLESLEKKVKKLGKEIKDLEEEVNKLKKEKENYDGKVKKLSKEKQSSEKQLEEAKSKVQELKKESQINESINFNSVKSNSSLIAERIVDVSLAYNKLLVKLLNQDTFQENDIKNAKSILIEVSNDVERLKSENPKLSLLQYFTQELKEPISNIKLINCT